MVSDVKLLFWNLKKNSNGKWIAEVLEENDVDVAIFAEYREASCLMAKHLLKNEYMWHDGFGACDKITIISRNSVSVRIRREQDRYTIYYISLNNEGFIIAGVHLPAPPMATASDRKDVIRDLIHDICEQERILKTIVNDINNFTLN